MKILIVLLITVINIHAAAVFVASSSNCLYGPVAGSMLNSTNSITIFTSRDQAGSTVFTLLSKGDSPSSQKSLYVNRSGSGFGYYSQAQGTEYSRNGGTPTKANFPFNNITSYVYGQSNIIVLTNGILESGKIWAVNVPVALPELPNTFPLRVGSRLGNIQFYEGILNDIAVWNTNLTYIECLNISASHIKGIARFIRPSSLTYYYSFDHAIIGQAITTEMDYSVNRITLTNEINSPTGFPENSSSYYPNE